MNRVWYGQVYCKEWARLDKSESKSILVQTYFLSKVLYLNNIHGKSYKTWLFLIIIIMIIKNNLVPFDFPGMLLNKVLQSLTWGILLKYDFRLQGWFCSCVARIQLQFNNTIIVIIALLNCIRILCNQEQIHPCTPIIFLHRIAESVSPPNVIQLGWVCFHW